MSLKMTFLGTGSAFTIGDGNYQSNVLLTLNNDSLLIDAGTDIRFSLNELHLSYKNIHNIYITHVHGDHIGGLEWIALNTFFDTEYFGKPTLFASESILKNLWDSSLTGGLSTQSTQESTLHTYFSVHPVSSPGHFRWQKIDFNLVQMVHVFNKFVLMPCYGLLFEYNSARIFFSADTQYIPHHLFELYENADIIFQDCETSPIKSGVHTHYNELRLIPAVFKKKMWLYHYNPGILPDAKADGFLGFVAKGQCFDF